MEPLLGDLSPKDEWPLKRWLVSLKKQRHDFMNDIQVIWGYLSINRVENAVYYIQQVIQRQERIARIQLLEHELLVLYLLTYNDTNRQMILEVDVAPQFTYQGLRINGEILFDIVRQLLDIYEMACRAAETSQTLSLFIDRLEDGLLLTSHFDGEVSEKRFTSAVQQLLAAHQKTGLRLFEEIDMNDTVIKLYIA